MRCGAGPPAGSPAHQRIQLSAAWRSRSKSNEPEIARVWSARNGSTREWLGRLGSQDVIVEGSRCSQLDEQRIGRFGLTQTVGGFRGPEQQTVSALSWKLNLAEFPPNVAGRSEIARAKRYSAGSIGGLGRQTAEQLSSRPIVRQRHIKVSPRLGDRSQLKVDAAEDARIRARRENHRELLDCLVHRPDLHQHPRVVETYLV